MRPDLASAERYLTLLDESAAFFTWQTFDDAALGRSNLIKIIHAPLDGIREQLVDLNNRGAGVYICINETDGKGRKIENVTRIRAVFADLDGAPLEGVQQCPLEPHLIVESSPGKFHAYWLVDGLPREQFKPIQKVIAARFESDPAVNDLPRILRVPGFIHRKGDPFQVRIIHESGARPYSADEIRTEFDPAKAEGLRDYTGPAPETDARGFQSHLAMIGHHEGGGGFHWPITRAIAAYVAQYGKDAPIAPLKAMLRATVDRADRHRYTDAQLQNIKSDIYLDRAIAGALKRYGESKPDAVTVGEVYEKVQAVAGGKVVHLSDRKAAEHPQAWQDGLTRNEHKALHASLANIVLILSCDSAWHGVLAWDIFSQRIIKRRRPPFEVAAVGEWDDRDDSKTTLWLSHNYGIRPSTKLTAEAVGIAADRASFHPIQEYLKALVWDKKPRVRMWLTRYLGCPDSPYSRSVGSFWLVGAVARVMRPGCKMDNVLILEGPQGKGKSTALAILGGEWFSDTPFELGSKDSFLAIRGKWIIELSELDNFNRAESTRAKHFFAASRDTYREPYGRRTIDVIRQCVFAGTTNSNEYLRDDSGNRRYWPIRTATIAHERLLLDRDQLWAEAVAMFEANEPWWFDQAPADITCEQDARFVVDPWHDRINEFVENRRRMTPPTTHFNITVSLILEECLQIPIARWAKIDQMRVGSVLKRLGFERLQIRDGNRRYWAYGEPHTE